MGSWLIKLKKLTSMMWIVRAKTLKGPNRGPLDLQLNALQLSYRPLNDIKIDKLL